MDKTSTGKSVDQATKGRRDFTSNSYAINFKMTKHVKWQNVYNDKRFKKTNHIKWQNVENDKTYEITKHINANCVKWKKYMKNS